VTFSFRSFEVSKFRGTADPISTPQRIWRFNVVGAIGIAVQFAVLAALAKLAHLPTSLATAIAVTVTVAHNFAWHERYTFRDRGCSGGREIVGRFLRFNLTTGAISVLGNVVFTTLLAEHARLPLLVANGAAIAICGLLNYVASDRVVFR
jgi:putative flippase GtrA